MAQAHEKAARGLCDNRGSIQAKFGQFLEKTVLRFSQNGHKAMLEHVTVIPPTQPDT